MVNWLLLRIRCRQLLIDPMSNMNLKYLKQTRNYVHPRSGPLKDTAATC
jgi:hypothetical protein